MKRRKEILIQNDVDRGAGRGDGVDSSIIESVKYHNVFIIVVFVISFEITKCKTYNFALLFQGCLGYSGSLAIPHKF